MQGDQLKAMRGELGMSQQQFADAIGMSRKAIGEMERGDAPIEKRTALAAQHIVNSLLPFYGNRQPRPLETDIPIASACVLWDDEGALDPPVKVIGSADGDDRDYYSSYGKGNSEWDVLDDAGRLTRLLAHFVVLVIDERIAPSEVHKAFSVVPEYRQAFHEAFRNRLR